VTATTGAVRTQATVAATPAGDRQLLALADQQPGQRVWAIEGTGGSGAGLTRFLQAHAEQVGELDRPTRPARRHGAKSDPLDAIRAAHQALGRDQLAQPRAAGARAALQARLTTRRSAVQAGTDAQRQLHALVVAAPDALCGRLGALTTRRLVTTCGRLRLRAAWDPETIATAASLRALARRIHLLEVEIADHTRAITTLVRAWRPELLTRTGVGPIVAANLRWAWPRSGSLPDRRRLRHAGRGRADPGRIWPEVRVRLHRSGDRHLNQALQLIMLTRLGYDPATRADAQRRRAAGKTNREIRRCLVRTSPASATDSS
jgi:transposase